MGDRPYFSSEHRVHKWGVGGLRGVKRVSEVGKISTLSRFLKKWRVSLNQDDTAAKVSADINEYISTYIIRAIKVKQ